MHLTALLVLAIGLVGLIFGVRMYTDQGYRRFLTQRSLGTFRFLKFGPGPALPVTMILNGFSVSLIGVALWIGRNTVTLALVWAACGVIALSVVMYVVAPTWSRPRWMFRD